MESQKVTLYTEKFMIVGEIAMKGGYRKRLSDILNSKELQFLPILNAKISPVEASSRSVTEMKVLVLNKNVIVFAQPEDEESEGSPEEEGV